MRCRAFRKIATKPISNRSGRRSKCATRKKEATFSGNVKVVQGDTTMTSKSLVVFYEASRGGAGDTRPRPPLKGTKAAPGAVRAAAGRGPGPGGKFVDPPAWKPRAAVRSSRKRSRVRDRREPPSSTPRPNLITMTGGVVLTQCKERAARRPPAWWT